MSYRPQKITKKLIKTALGESYYGDALHDAMDFPCVTEEEKRCLHRYMHGSELNGDHWTLQHIAHKIMQIKE